MDCDKRAKLANFFFSFLLLFRLPSSEMTDHSDIITSSNSSCTSRMAPARVRIVRLVRNSGLYRLSCQTATFGFSIRGGREFGIGFFVSHVDPDSEADIRGLKVNNLIK